MKMKWMYIHAELFNIYFTGVEDTATAEGDELGTPFQKIGTKRLRKIKEKAERKALREVYMSHSYTYEQRAL